MRCRVSPADAGLRLDVWLTTQSQGSTRSQVRHWIDEDRVHVNDQVEKAGYPLKAGDTVVWEPPAPADAGEGPPPEPIPLVIIHVDDDIVVVDKKPGMVVHPGAGVFSGTLIGALKGAGISTAPTGGPLRPGVVHRLDRGTSGLIVVARTDPAYQALVKAIAARRVRRSYRALVWGVIRDEEGRIEGSIRRSRDDRRRMTVTRTGGRAAATRFRVRNRFRFLTDLDLELETGRTHQIRVHCRHLGHPVFGDPEYGGRSPRAALPPGDRLKAREWLSTIDRQALHAARLEFDHPVTGRALVFEAPLPADMERLFALVAEDSVS